MTFSSFLLKIVCYYKFEIKIAEKAILSPLLENDGYQQVVISLKKTEFEFSYKHTGKPVYKND